MRLRACGTQKGRGHGERRAKDGQLGSRKSEHTKDIGGANGDSSGVDERPSG
jgi:hypothetical protein